MRKLFVILAVSLPAFAALHTPLNGPARAADHLTLLRAERLLDPRTGNVLSPAAVLIENDKVKEVGSPSQLQADAPADVKTIDLGGATLLPGLIDCHTHLLLDII